MLRVSRKALPERGRIGIFNRSYYEELAVVRVHEAILENEQLSRGSTHDLWKDRYEEITGFEWHLTRKGTRVIKRLLERIDAPEENEKLSQRTFTSETFGTIIIACIRNF